MIKVLGENYYIDLDEVEKYLDMSDKSIDKTSEDKDSDISETKINIIKFEMVKMLMDTVLTENEDTDEKLGSIHATYFWTKYFCSNQTPLPRQQRHGSAT